MIAAPLDLSLSYKSLHQPRTAMHHHPQNQVRSTIWQSSLRLAIGIASKRSEIGLFLRHALPKGAVPTAIKSLNNALLQKYVAADCLLQHAIIRSSAMVSRFPRNVVCFASSTDDTSKREGLYGLYRLLFQAPASTNLVSFPVLLYLQHITICAEKTMSYLVTYRQGTAV